MLELRFYLEEIFELAEPMTEYAVAKYWDTNANGGAQVVQIRLLEGLKLSGLCCPHRTGGSAFYGNTSTFNRDWACGERNTR